jgi:DHA1 family tetracycline resistance protein-like MFS transporter
MQALSQGLADPRLRTLVVIYFLFMLGFTMMEATLTLFIEKRIGSTDHAQLVRRVGYLFGFIGAIQVALQGGLVGRLARRFGESRLLAAGCVLAMIALGSVPLVGSWLALYAVALGLAVSGGLTQPSVASLISRAAGAGTQGSALGTSQSAASLARVVGPAMAGALFQQFSPAAPYFVAAALALAAAACVRLRE